MDSQHCIVVNVEMLFLSFCYLDAYLAGWLFYAAFEIVHGHL